MIKLNIKKNFRFEETTGVWLDCDTQSNNFDRCLFHQALDDDMDFDHEGMVSKNGSVRIFSPPQYQWGPRCLSIRVKTSTKITLSVYGTFAENSNRSVDTITYHEETIQPTEEKIANFPKIHCERHGQWREPFPRASTQKY